MICVIKISLRKFSSTLNSLLVVDFCLVYFLKTEELKSQLETTALGDPVDKSGDKRIASIKLYTSHTSSCRHLFVVSIFKAVHVGYVATIEIIKFISKKKRLFF